MTDSAGLSDEVIAELNPPPEGPPRPGQLDPLPERPADSASKAKWVDYVIALGADRGFVEGDTEHYDAIEEAMVTLPGLTRDELQDLADRLMGSDS